MRCLGYSRSGDKVLEMSREQGQSTQPWWAQGEGQQCGQLPAPSWTAPGMQVSHWMQLPWFLFSLFDSRLVLPLLAGITPSLHTRKDGCVWIINSLFF